MFMQDSTILKSQSC